MTDTLQSKLRPPFLHSTALGQTEAIANAPAAEPEGRQEWRAFDWKSAASLRAPVNHGMRGDREWGATHWDELSSLVSPEAEQVAEQLNSIAEKIRKGELSIEGKGPTPETAMVVALEALVRAR